MFTTYGQQMLVLRWPIQAAGSQSSLRHDLQSWI